MSLTVVPLTFKAACEFVAALHRHNKPPVGMKFAIGAQDDDGQLRGVAIAGRPVARSLDNGLTLEINRTCTDGYHNANSLLYGACRKAAFAMGYTAVITYTQADEPGTSLHAAGFVRTADLPARGSWAESSGPQYKQGRDPVGNGGVPRVRWECRRKTVTAQAVEEAVT